MCVLWHSAMLILEGGTGPIYLDDMRCNGNEANILDCPHDPNTHDCRHYEDSGVRCRVGGGHHMYIVHTLTLTHTCTTQEN